MPEYMGRFSKRRVYIILEKKSLHALWAEEKKRDLVLI